MKVGDRIDDRFELEGTAGSGGMGTVYRARDETTGTTVALKMLHENAARERFEREARVLASLAHPGIVRYVAHGMHDSAPYLAMEWLEGEDLDQRLSRRAMTVGETVSVIEGIARALSVAHARGIVHRDIKPSNIFLVGCEVERAKLLDFGIAVGGAMAKRQTKTGSIVGTPGYMAPEQARGARDVDARADLFSLGCVLFECLTGRPAFMGEQLMAILAKILLEDAPRASDIVGDVPQDLDELLAKLLAKSPAQRPTDAREVLLALGSIDRDALVPGPSTTRRSALGTGEQRFASVIVIGRANAADGATLSVDEASRVPETICSAAQPFETHVEVLADGAVFITLLGPGGAPTDQAARAAACALAIRRVEPEVPIALVMGRGEIKDHVPVGEAIDRAARLVRLPAPSTTGGIRINELTDALLDARFHRVPDSAGVVLVGQSEVDAARTLLGRPTPCVGRETELAMLEGMVAQAFGEPVSRAVVVTAAAGVGKSRLRHELVSWAHARPDDVQIWIARADPIGAHSAFGLASQLVRRTAGVLDGEPLDLRRNKLLARVARNILPKHQPRVATFLGELVGSPFPDDTGGVPLLSARRDVILMGDQIRRAWEDFVDGETSERPLLIVLEDLHWGDLPTVALVDAALRLFVERPLFVLALARPEVDELFVGLWKERDAQRIALAPLTRKASEKLIRSSLGEAATANVLSRLVELSSGNAFHLEELIRSVAEHGSDVLPETVVAMVEARLESLEPDTRRILRAASVFGQVFWANGVAALGGARCEHLLDELTRRELVTARPHARFVGETEYAFRHALVREAAYATLTDADRALGHALAAGWLESVGETDTMALAEHFERGGERPRAVLAYTKAVEEALEGNDLDGAIARAQRGVECGASDAALGHLLQLEALALWWRGDQAKAARVGSEAVLRLPFGSDRWGDAMGELAIAFGSQGATQELAGCVADLAATTGSAPSAGCVLGAVRASIALMHSGMYAESESLLSTVAAAAEAAPDVTTRARLQHARAEQATRSGDTGSYLALMTAALHSFHDAGDARNECIVLSNVGFAHLEIGAFQQAKVALTAALATAKRMGLRNAGAGAMQNLGLVFARLGLFDEARASALEAAAEFNAMGNLRMEGISRLYASSILDEAADTERAEAEARKAVTLLEDNPPSRAYALAVLSRILRRQSRSTEALASARDSIALLDRLGGLQEGEGTVRLAFAEALDACGNRVEATRAIARARERLLERASGIADEAQRKSFIENVPDHATTLRLAEAWV